MINAEAEPKKEDYIDQIMNGEVEEVDVEKLQQKFENLEFQMASAEPERKSVLLVKQALIYVQIGDTDEALVLLNQAIETDPDNKEAQKLRKKLLPPPPSIAERIRSFTKSKKLQLSLKQKYEYDSNIVLEAKDPTQPSNKDDAVYSASLGLGKAWGKGHVSNYSFFFDIHAENKNFDLMAHTLSHSWGKKLSEKMTLVLPVSISHYSLDHEALLWSTDLSPMLMYKLNLNWMSTFELGYRDSSYFADANNGLESKQSRLRVGFMKTFDSKIKQNAKVKLAYLNEDTNLKSVAYQQIGLDLGYTVMLNYNLIDRLNLGALYHNRDYDEAAVGLAKREDDRLTLRVSLSKAILDGQSLQLNFQHVDNDSNLNASKYDKYKVGFAWDIIL
jgi:tetratricopeptide (TPR) repeat protein